MLPTFHEVKPKAIIKTAIKQNFHPLCKACKFRVHTNFNHLSESCPVKVPVRTPKKKTVVLNGCFHWSPHTRSNCKKRTHTQLHIGQEGHETVYQPRFFTDVVSRSKYALIWIFAAILHRLRHAAVSAVCQLCFMGRCPIKPTCQSSVDVSHLSSVIITEWAGQGGNIFLF